MEQEPRSPRPERRRRRACRATKAVKLALGVAIAALLAGAGTAYAIGGHGHHRKARGQRGTLSAVQVATAATGVAVSELSLSGLVAGSGDATVSPGVAGRVLSVAVSVGQAVQAGQVLVRLANPVLQAQLAEAEAAVVTAQAKLTAAAAGPTPQAVAVAQAEVAKAQAALEAAQQAQAASGTDQAALALAEAQAAQAEAPPPPPALAPLQAAVTQASDAEAVVAAQVAQETVTAPFAGTVGSLSAVAGEQVAPASTLLVLDGPGVSVQAAVSEQDWRSVRPGETARISLPSGSASAAASVTSVAPSGNPSSLTFAVGLTPQASPPWLVPGEAVTVAVVTSRTSGAVLVPASAVVAINGHPQVFAVHSVHSVHAVSLVDVTPGISDGRTTAVTGLRPGAEVVTLGQTYLAPGDRVRVTGRASTPTTVTGSSVGGLLTAPAVPTGARGARAAVTRTAGRGGVSGGSTGMKRGSGKKG